MVRIKVVIAAAAVASCTAACPRPVVGLGSARVEDGARGIPKTVSPASLGLLEEALARRCQVLFEPSFASPHAVWIVQEGEAADATVFVKVRINDDIATYSAALDGHTAARLSNLCRAALSSKAEACARSGSDGTWYHAAHPDGASSYLMASFWSPRTGTLADAFVKLAEALRNYATLPAPLRSESWYALQEAANDLGTRLKAEDSG
jgi:hypothetical protein